VRLGDRRLKGIGDARRSNINSTNSLRSINSNSLVDTVDSEETLEVLLHPVVEAIQLQDEAEISSPTHSRPTSTAVVDMAVAVDLDVDSTDRLGEATQVGDRPFDWMSRGEDLAGNLQNRYGSLYRLPGWAEEVVCDERLGTN
jgi:hypothetical protein